MGEAQKQTLINTLIKKKKDLGIIVENMFTVR